MADTGDPARIATRSVAGERNDPREDRSTTKLAAALATAYRIRLEVIMIDLALRFPQDGLKVAWRGRLGEPLAIAFSVR
jgi:hypothetical protein